MFQFISKVCISKIIYSFTPRGGFVAEFKGVKPGNYRVTLTQGTNSSTFKTIAI